MKAFTKFVLLFSVWSLLSSFTEAAEPRLWLFDTRGNEIAAASFCAQTPNCSLIDTVTKEFSNGETFVRVMMNLTGESAGIYLPETLDPLHLMEVLIKIRTAKTLGARKITVYTPKAFAAVQIPALPELQKELETLIGVAGADKIVEGSNPARNVDVVSVVTPRENLTHSILVNDRHASLAEGIAAALKIPLLQRHELKDDLLKNAQVLFVKPVINPKSETFFDALEFIRASTRKGAAVTWITPLPWARSDKADQSGVTVTGRLIADLIENSGAEAMVFARAHAPQSQGFFKIPSFNVSGRQTIDRYLREQKVEMIVSPDAGFQKEATLFGDALHIPVAVANKQRDPITSALKLYGMSGPSPLNKVVAIVDDETESGGTLAEVAGYLKKLGALRVIAVVTHLAGDATKALNSPYIDHIVATDSYPRAPSSEKSKILLLSLGDELAQALFPLTIKNGNGGPTPDCAAMLAIPEVPGG